MSTIYIVAPISGAVMSLSFRLPNGDEVNPDLADTVHNAVEILKGVDLPAGVHVWSYAIPKSVTAISGTVMYTITTTTESFVATGSGTFVVAPATTKTLPSSAPGADVWEEILSELARIYAEMRTVLGTSPVTGLDGLSTTVTALISKIAALIGNEPIESPLGGATTISTLLDWLKDESVRFSAVIGGGSISFAGSLIEAVNTLREISVVKTSDPSRVYATASDGSPAFLPYAETPTAYSVPQRDGAGRVKTASPASASDAVDFGTFSADKERVGKLITDLQTAVNRLSRAFAFDTWEAALGELTKPALAEAKEKYKIGDAILIRDVEAPDGWVSGYADFPDPYPGGNNIQNPFDGTDAFTVGWLIISPLESPKLSLDGYATTAEAKALADAAESEAKAYADEKVGTVIAEVREITDNAVAEAKDYVNDAINSFDPPSADKVERLEAQVANLTAQIAPEYFTTDSSVAYSKTVPAAALPFAEVKEVGGMSYAEGGEIKNAAVTALETVGVNILDISAALNDRLVDNGDGTYTLRNIGGSRFSAEFPLNLPNGYAEINCSVEILDTNVEGLTNISIRTKDPANGTQLSGFSLKVGGQDYGVKSGVADIYLPYPSNAGDYVTFKNPMIKIGLGYIGYVPYAKHTLPIPAEVQALDGWGLGVDETYHNRIVWDPENGVKQYRQEIGRIDLGTLAWTPTGGRFKTVAPISGIKFFSNEKSVCLSDVYQNYPYNELYRGINTEGFTGISVDGSGYIQVVDSAYGSVGDFITAMQGKMLLYALATPIVTDLPTVLDDNNFIKVEGGGTITAENEHMLAAPTTVIYQKKEVTA
jgi:hypothetical protein